MEELPQVIRGMAWQSRKGIKGFRLGDKGGKWAYVSQACTSQVFSWFKHAWNTNTFLPISCANSRLAPAVSPSASGFGGGDWAPEELDQAPCLVQHRAEGGLFSWPRPGVQEFAPGASTDSCIHTETLTEHANHAALICSRQRAHAQANCKPCPAPYINICWHASASINPTNATRAEKNIKVMLLYLSSMLHHSQCYTRKARVYVHAGKHSDHSQTESSACQPRGYAHSISMCSAS